MAKIFDDLISLQVHALFAENCSRSLFTNLLEASTKTGDPLKNIFQLLEELSNIFPSISIFYCANSIFLIFERSEITLKSILFFHDFDILLQKEALSVTLAFRAIFF